jgi:hypothetical protein
MQDYCGRMKRSGRDHERNLNWGSTSLITSIEKTKTKPRLVKQVLRKPQERNKEHLKLRGRERRKGRERGSLRSKNKAT